MATTQDIHAPTLGAQGEPCASCGAPLAGDQRYCLECGARRAQARLPFRDILATGGAAPPPAPAAAAAPASEGPPARSGLAFLAGLLCLIAALGVGVLIGDSGDDRTAATTPPPQVITVGGAAAAAPAATTPAATTSTPAASSSGSTKSSKDSGSSSSSAKSSKGSAADKKKVQDLNSSSGADYQKKSQKLPKEVGTSGKPAPKDNKPAGGGSGFEDIG
jgi:hypothetical protein